jgi:beta-xylosidase
MAQGAARTIREVCPGLPVVLGGISPIDPEFIKLLGRHGLLDWVDAVAVHGFPLDWNLWPLDDWPSQIARIQAVTSLPIWVTEAGASSFGADEVQVLGLRRTSELLKGKAERVFWYSLLDLPPDWEATTRHKESEGSSYYRHFYMGLLRANGEPKPALDCFPPEFGICQWFHFEDPRLELAVKWLKKIGVKKLRTGLSWADWHRPNAAAWFDRQMEALADFDLTLTLCFTPPSRGKIPHYTSPPLLNDEFAWFTREVIERYGPRPSRQGAKQAGWKAAPDLSAARA